MLVDRITKQTYSSRNAAIRELGKDVFIGKAKRKELDYVQCTFV